MATNLDEATVAGFGEEWARHDQSGLTDAEFDTAFERYFHIFPWSALPSKPVGMDVGCGSGRWAKRVAQRVAKLYCIDASEKALAVAARNLAGQPNCELVHAAVDAIPIDDASLDFAYSLGVLHHVPDTQAGIEACVRKLKPGGVMLLYLYYAFDNRPLWYRLAWRASDVARRAISTAPQGVKTFATDTIAAGVYFPLARSAALARRLGVKGENWPLGFYADASFYTMRTDALDRFGTRLEQRFTKKEMKQMMESAGLERIEFSDAMPHWCAVGYRAVK